MESTNQLIEVQINGEKTKIAVGTTVATILKNKDVRPEMVAVEVNGELLPKGAYNSYVLEAGDQMEFLFYMAGGGSS